jgi:hypothetical protein
MRRFEIRNEPVSFSNKIQVSTFIFQPPSLPITIGTSPKGEGANHFPLGK